MATEIPLNVIKFKSKKTRDINDTLENFTKAVAEEDFDSLILIGYKHAAKNEPYKSETTIHLSEQPLVQSLGIIQLAHDLLLKTT